MKLNFKMKLLCGILALVLLVPACGKGNPDSSQTGSLVEDSENVSVEDEDKEVVGSAPDTEAGTEEVIEDEFAGLTEEEKEWMNLLMADVDVSLRIREKPTTESDILGVLDRGAKATVIEKGAEWTKIRSGELEGYVSSQFCVYGLDALAFAKEICDTVVTCTVESLNIRQGMSTDSAVLGKLEKDKSLVVDLSVPTEEGWVAVTYNGVTAYVNTVGATVGLNITEAITIEDLYIREKYWEFIISQNQAQGNGGNTSSTPSTPSSHPSTWPVVTTKETACVANATEYEVLAAMIWCESGNQSYECNLAVASVIMNRVRSGQFPNTVKDVVFAPGQFPPATGGPLEKCLLNGSTTENCYKAAQAAMNGEDNTDGCLYFNTNHGTREGLVIGTMVFWKKW